MTTSPRRASGSAFRRRSGALAGAVLAAAGCVACGGQEPDDPALAACATSAPPIELEGPAAMFDFAGAAVPTRYVSQDGYLVINGRSEMPIPDLAIKFIEIVGAAGFDIAGSDDEGFEAEVFFSRGDIAAGMVVLTESACPGVVDVKISVLDDPAVLPDGDSSPSAAPPG